MSQQTPERAYGVLSSILVRGIGGLDRVVRLVYTRSYHIDTRVHDFFHAGSFIILNHQNL